MKGLVEFVARSLVDDPDEVMVRQERTGSKVFLQLRVAKDDMGRIIGKNGKVANAIRVLLRVAAARDGKQVSLDIVEPK